MTFPVPYCAQVADAHVEGRHPFVKECGKLLVGVLTLSVMSWGMTRKRLAVRGNVSQNRGAVPDSFRTSHKLSSAPGMNGQGQ